MAAKPHFALRGAGFAAAAALLTGCSNLSARSDADLCKHIGRFASASTDLTPRSVTLTTDWANFSKSCKHDAREPGIALCQWLMENTSTEFMVVNIRRVLSCFDENGLAGPPRASVDYLTGKIRVYKPRIVYGQIWIEIEYAEGSGDALPSLSITAARF